MYAGWEPNVPILHESTAGGMCSTFWRLLPQPTDGPDADTTYNSQARHAAADGNCQLQSAPPDLGCTSRRPVPASKPRDCRHPVLVPHVPHVTPASFYCCFAVNLHIRAHI